MEVELTVDQLREAWLSVCRAIRRHENAHGELPRFLYVGIAGATAIKLGVEGECIGDWVDDVQIVLVGHWDVHTTMTLA